MPTQPLQALREELGAAAASLPDLSAVPDPALHALVDAVRAAKQHQRQLLADAGDHALRMVPALLRPAVRKVLFG